MYLHVNQTLNQLVKNEGAVRLDFLWINPIARIGFIIFQDILIILLGVHVFALSILRKRMYTHLTYIQTMNISNQCTCEMTGLSLYNM